LIFEFLFSESDYMHIHLFCMKNPVQSLHVRDFVQARMHQMSSHNGPSKFTLRIGFALALGASITGCTVGPHYQRPSVKLQPFHNAPSIETRTASLPAPALDQWWTGFHDPELTRIVQRALDQNLDLTAAMTRVQQARAAARGAGAQRLPSGSLNASTTTLYQSTESMTGRLATHVPGYQRTQNYYDLGFAASGKPIYSAV
jgi:hypothetical protein